VTIHEALKTARAVQAALAATSPVPAFVVDPLG